MSSPSKNSKSNTPTKRRQGSFVQRISRRGSEVPGMKFNSFGEPVIEDPDAEAAA